VGGEEETGFAFLASSSVRTARTSARELEDYDVRCTEPIMKSQT